MIQDRIAAYYGGLQQAIARASVTGRGHRVVFWAGFSKAQEMALTAHTRGNTIFFIGNGGSAAIASHMAIDFEKAGDLRARAFNDAAALTCLANDINYASVFAEQIAKHARKGDLLFAISSSGKSRSILEGVEEAHVRGCGIVTFSGFAPDNPLRQKGDLNFYVGSDSYGIVEVAHLALLHGILDLLAHVDETHQSNHQQSVKTPINTDV